MHLKNLLILISICLIFNLVLPQAEASSDISWNIATNEDGEFVTAFAHLYGVPQIEKEYELYFSVVELDARQEKIPDEGIIEVSVGGYTQTATKAFKITTRKTYTFGLNPTFNDNIAQISSPTPVTVDLKITDENGNQIHADSKTIQVLPINYYIWGTDESDMRPLSLVLSTPHAEPIQKILSTAAKATPWNAIPGYQEFEGYSHAEIVDIQMRTVYNVLQNLDINYVHSPTTFSSTKAQKIRTPIQTINDGSGNCVETSLLFDAIFEAIGLDVNIIFTSTHSFLAVSEWSNSKNLMPLETTLIGSNTYDEAKKVGHENLKEANYDPAHLIVNVRQIRQGGISPTPYMDKMPDRTKFYDNIEHIRSDITKASDLINQARNLIQEGTTIPIEAETSLKDAENLFMIGKYEDAKRNAGKSISIITGIDLQDTNSNSDHLLLGEEKIFSLLDAYFDNQPSSYTYYEIPTEEDIFKALDEFFSSGR